MRKTIFFIMLALTVGAVASVAALAGGRKPVTARVVGVVAGDTLTVRLHGGKVQQVRVLGVSAPPVSSCYGKQSRDATRALVLNKTVKLGSAASSSYVTLANGHDLGATLLTGGSAQIDGMGPAFSRLPSYTPLQQAAETANKGMWSTCAADLSVDLSSDASAVIVGNIVTYTATIKNAGPLAAPFVDLDVRAPQGNPIATAASVTGHSGCTPHTWYATCSFDSIPAGGTAEASFMVDTKQTGTASATALVRISGCIATKCGRQPLHDSNLNNDRSGAVTAILPVPPPGQPAVPPQLPVNHWIPGGNCDPHYPTVCMPPAPPYYHCGDLSFRGFEVLHYPLPTTPDPDAVDNNFDGVGCTFDDY